MLLTRAEPSHMHPSLWPPGNLLSNLVNNDGTLSTIYIALCCSDDSNTCIIFGASPQTLIHATPLNSTSNVHITPTKLPSDFGVPGCWSFWETAATKRGDRRKNCRRTSCKVERNASHAVRPVKRLTWSDEYAKYATMTTDNVTTRIVFKNTHAGKKTVAKSHRRVQGWAREA